MSLPFTLTRKARLGAVLWLIVSIALCIVILSNILEIKTTINHVSNDTIEYVRLVGFYNTDVQRLLAEMSTYAYKNDLEDLQQAREASERLHRYVEELHRLDRTLIQYPVPDQATDRTGIIKRQQDLLVLLDREIETISQLHRTDRNAAIVRVNTVVEDLEKQGYRLAEDSTLLIARERETIIEQSLYRLHVALTINILTLIGLIVLISVGIWLLEKRIIVPVKELAWAAVDVTAGNLDVQVSHNRRDEFGVLQQSFNCMIGTLRQNMHELQTQYAQAVAARQLAEALRLNDERFALAARAGKMGIIEIFPQTHAVYLSPDLLNLLGYSDEEHFDTVEAWFNLIFPDDRDQMFGLLSDYTTKESQCEHEYRMLHKDGSVLWFNIRCLALRDEAGNIYRVVGVNTDITRRKQAEMEREHALALAKAVGESATGGIMVTTLNGRINTFNKRYTILWQLPDNWFTESVTFGEHLSIIQERVQDAPAFVERIQTIVKRFDKDFYDVVPMCDGRTLERYSTPYRVAGQTMGRLWSYRDVTKRMRIEEELRQLNVQLEQRVQERTSELVQINRRLEESMAELTQAYTDIAQSEARKEALINAIPDSMLLIQPDGHILESKVSSTEIFCVLLRPGEGNHLHTIFCDPISVLYQKYIQQAIHTDQIQIFEYQIPRTGKIMHYEARLVVCRTNEVLAVIRDITEHKHAEQQLRRLALHDGLTGLPNRVLLNERMCLALERCKRKESYRFALLLIDVDDFKRINDGLGHLAGDAMLRALANRFMNCVRTVDTVARLGGDEFAILLDDVSGEQAVMDVAERLLLAIAEPFSLMEQDVYISISIGIVLNADHHAQASDMLRDADIALYKAKDCGKGQYVFFDTEMFAQVSHRLALETDLRYAIAREELCVFYQPIVALATRNLIGFEALVRWQHAQQGLLLPNTFLPLAAEIGLDVQLDRWLLRQACYQLRDWQREKHISSLSISVNLSNKHFIQYDLVDYIEDLVHDTGIQPHCLMLEITENSLIEYNEQSLGILKRLRALGIRIALDDFGTGYSSLSYLHRFPVDVLKIDRSFIKSIDSDACIVEVVRALIQLARNLDIDVIAEGAETNEHLEHLHALNCPYVQGYIIAKPLDCQATQEFLATSKE